jgi:hypothetical protein
MSATPPDDLRLHALAMIKQLDEAERRHLQKMEQDLCEARKVLTEVAYRVAGLALEKLRRMDPFVPEKWSLDDWRDFFTRNAHTENVPWGMPADYDPELARRASKLEKENTQLTQANVDLKSQLAAAQEVVTDLQRQVSDRDHALSRLQAALAGRDGALATRLPAADPPPALQPIAEPVVVTHPVTHAALPVDEQRDTLIEAAAQLQSLGEGPPHVPAGFTRFPCIDINRQSTTTDHNLQQAIDNHRRRQTLALYVLSRHGINIRARMQQLIASASGTAYRKNGKLDRILDLMGDERLGGFVVIEKMSMTVPTRTNLIAYRLTESGRELCRAFGWGEPVESDWDRLIRLHQGDREDMKPHTLGVLTFADHARRRGYHVTVMPETGSAVFRPDVLIERDGERCFVEVEMSDKSIKTNKWTKLAEAQGFIALCAPNPGARENLAAHCAPLGVPVLSCDLETLIVGIRGKDDVLVVPDPLWAGPVR